jgi:hypothetical protein
MQFGSADQDGMPAERWDDPSNDWWDPLEELASMSRQRSCSFCHTMNDVTVDLCRHCGHQAHVPRMICQCAQCTTPLTLTVEGVVRDLEAAMREADQTGQVAPLQLQMWIAMVGAIRATLAQEN